MKLLKMMLITLVLCSVSVLSLSCGSESDPESAPEQQVVSVQRGDLTVDITASGNLALSVMEDLAFEMAGTVEEILVKEGDSVAEGQLLAKLDTSEWDKELTNLELALLQAEINLENAELTLEQAEEETTVTVTGDVVAKYTDPREIDVLELKVKLAEAHYEDAKEALEEALDASPEVAAPFDGFIIGVNVEGGDEVLKGTVAVKLADPNKFEADILVSEMDIVDIELGGTALVEVDALGVAVPAEVTHISPTATIQSGVVNYTVKVELQSLETVIQEQQAALADIQLREGLTVTVSIIVDERNDVLLVPNGAIITRGRQTYIQVMSPDGTIEERAITTSISNWQYTEVTEGLSEGEQVVVPQGTATSTTTQQGTPPGGMRIPGMGSPR